MQISSEILEEVGLSRNEAKIYLAMLELGTATAGRIAKKAGIFRSCTYDSIKGLIKRGLASTVSIGTVAHYHAADPKLFRECIKTRMEKLEKIIPILELGRSFTQPCTVEVFEGLTAIKNMLLSLLDTKEPQYTFGTPALAAQLLGSFTEIYHARRVERNILFMMIYNSDAKERVQYLNTLPHTKARHFAPALDGSVATTICGDHVLITDYMNQPKMIHIRNAELAEAYHRYFTLLWEKACETGIVQ